MTYRLALLAAISLTSLATACGQKETSSAKSRPVVPKQAAVNNASSKSYLMTAADVDAMKVMLPYVKPPTTLSAETGIGLGDTTVQAFRDQVAALLNQGLKLPALAPGRTMQVVLNTGYGIAGANGFQQIDFYKAAMDYKATSMLPVLCHELGHSAQNHAIAKFARMQTAAAKSARQQVDQACKTFTTAVYNEKTGEMTWKAAAWTKLAQVLKQNEPVLGEWVKRQESEADIDGAMICASMGLPVDSYIEGFNTFYAQPTSTPIPFNIKLTYEGDLDVSAAVDGTKEAMPLDKMQAGFCEIQDHPGDSERIEQLKRLKPQLTKYYNAKANTAGQFLARYDSLAKAAQAGLTELFDSQTAVAAEPTVGPTAAVPTAAEPTDPIGESTAPLAPMAGT